MLSTSKALFRKPGGGATPTTDASFGYVPLLLETGSASSLNTTVTDSSASPNTVTRVNNPSTGWVSPYQTDGYWGNYFNGSTDYLTVADNAALEPGASNFTIEAWVYLTQTSGNLQTIFSKGVSYGPILLSVNGTSVVYYLSSTGSSWNVASGVSGGSISINSWNHIALVRNGTTFTPYVNGVAGTTTTSSATLVNNATNVQIGANVNGSLEYLFGYISNWRYVVGTAVYTANFTPPTSPLTAITNTVLLTCQSNRFKDNGTANSGSPFTITVNGTPQVTPYFYPSGFTAPAASPGAALFSGTSQYLKSTTATTAFQFGTSPFTIEFWTYQTSRPARQYLCGGIFSGPGFQIFMDSPGVLRSSVTTIIDLPSASIAVPLNAWTHVALVRTSTSTNGASYYVNGVPAGTITISQDISGTASSLNVGTSGDSGSEPTNGYIANFRSVKGTAVYTGVFTPPSGPLTQNGGTYPSLTNVVTGFTAANTSLLLAMSDSNYNSATNGVQNNTFIDTGPYAFPITRNGTPTQGSITPYWPNGQWSNYFAGSQSISAPASSSFQFAGDFTIECWVFRTTTGDQTTYIQTNSTTYFALNVNAGTGLNIYLNSATASIAATDLVPALNVWNHVALVRSGSGSGNVKVYLNGVASATTATNTATLGYNLVAYVGSIGTQSSGSNVGYISNVRVVAAAVYTSNFTPPTTPLGAISGGQNPPTGTQTKLLTCQSNRFLDNSPVPFTITPNGTPTVQAFQPFSPTASYTTALYGGSGYFNGTSDYLTAPSAAVSSIGTGNFTIEGWFYSQDFTTRTNYFQRLWSFGNGLANNVVINLDNSGNLVYRNNDTVLITSSSAATLYNWYHVALVRNGTTTTMYLNGASVGTTSTSNNLTSPGGFPIYICNESGSTRGGYFIGYVSNFRVATGTAVYTGAFTPPTLAPLATTGPASAASYSSTTNVNTTFLTPASLLLNMANAAIYDAAAQNDLITAGNAQVSIAQAQFPPSSILFDGTGDYLEPVTTPALTLGTSNFTIEGWVYFNSVASFQIMYDQRPPLTNGAYPCLFMNGAVMTWFVNGVAQIASGSLSAGVWYYFAVTRSSSVTKMFINGSQVGSNYSDTTNYLATRTIIGISSYDFLLGINGYLEDFRITKGVGRTITPPPPTAPFPTR